MLRNDGPDGLSNNAEGLRTGGGSGFMAINLAALGGATRILLGAGYDNRMARGKHHYFGDHPDNSKQPYEIWRGRYRSMVKPLAELGIEVINCTPESDIDAFPKSGLEHELDRLLRDPPRAPLSA